MINSSDNSYVFRGSSNGNGMRGSIFDFKTDVFHHYNVTNIDNAVNFEYSDSRKLQEAYPDAIEKKVQFEYIITKIDSVKESVKIVKYKRKRKILGEVELIYSKNNSDYVFHNSALLFLSHHFYDKREIKNVNSRLPTSIQFTFNNKKMAKTTLIKKQKINTLLSITKEQLKYPYN